MKKFKFPGFRRKADEDAFASFSTAGKVTDGAYLQQNKEGGDVLTIYFRDGSFLEIKANNSRLEVKSEILENREHLEAHYGGTGFVFIQGVGDKKSA